MLFATSCISTVQVSANMPTEWSSEEMMNEREPSPESSDTTSTGLSRTEHLADDRQDIRSRTDSSFLDCEESSGQVYTRVISNDAFVVVGSRKRRLSNDSTSHDSEGSGKCSLTTPTPEGRADDMRERHPETNMSSPGSEKLCESPLSDELHCPQHDPPSGNNELDFFKCPNSYDHNSYLVEFKTGTVGEETKQNSLLTGSSKIRGSNGVSKTVLRLPVEAPCQVCGERASGNFFGALVCLPCKSFFIRCTKESEPVFVSRCSRRCDVTKQGRNRCQHCRYEKCLAAGMSRKEKPEAIEPGEGQLLCLVCGDIANGIHFGVYTCEGCKKFFRRGLQEYQTYRCKGRMACKLNPRNRNNCRYCRYQKCITVGMSREAIKMGRPKKVGRDDVSRENSNEDRNRSRSSPDTLPLLLKCDAVNTDEQRINHSSRLSQSSESDSSISGDSNLEISTDHLPWKKCILRSLLTVQEGVSASHEHCGDQNNSEISAVSVADSVDVNMDPSKEHVPLTSTVQNSERDQCLHVNGMYRVDPVVPGPTANHVYHGNVMDSLPTVAQRSPPCSQEKENSPCLNLQFKSVEPSYSKKRKTELHEANDMGFSVQNNMNSANLQTDKFKWHNSYERLSPEHLMTTNQLHILNSQGPLDLSNHDRSSHRPKEEIEMYIASSGDCSMPIKHHRIPYFSHSLGNGFTDADCVNYPSLPTSKHIPESQSICISNGHLHTGTRQATGLSRNRPFTANAWSEEYGFCQEQSGGLVECRATVSCSSGLSLVHDFERQGIEQEHPDEDSFMTQCCIDKDLEYEVDGLLLEKLDAFFLNGLLLLENIQHRLEAADSWFQVDPALPRAIPNEQSIQTNTEHSHRSRDHQECPSVKWLSSQFILPEERTLAFRLESSLRFDPVEVCQYWRQMKPLPRKMQMSRDQHRVLQDMLEAYMEMLHNLDEGQVQPAEKYSDTQDWADDDSSHLVRFVINRIIKQIKQELGFMYKVPGFSHFHSEDRMFIIQNMCFANVTLMGARDWYNPKTKTFRNMMTWELPRHHPLYTFRQNAMQLAEKVLQLQMDRTEAAMLSALNVAAADFIDMKEPSVIERTREFLMTALSTHLSYKGMDPAPRMKELFSLMPAFRLCGFWTKNIREEIALKAKRGNADSMGSAEYEHTSL